MSVGKRWRAGLGVLAALLFATACGGGGESPSDASERSAERSGSAATDEIAALVDGREISLAEVEAPLQIELHDLAVAAWEARRRQLEHLVARRLGDAGASPSSEEWGRRVEWRLAPPEPPRLPLSAAGAAVLGRPDAPVVLTIFVDFASSHVRVLQPALVRLRDVYGDVLALAFRQLPLPYHRFAVPAALAARCANAEGRFDAYAQALLQAGPDFTPDDLRALAARVGLEPGRFEACLEAPGIRREVDADLALAARLGVHRTPTVLVNGLYLAGRPGFEAIDAAVRGELARLGEPIPDRRSRDEGGATRSAPGAPAPPLPEIPPERLAEPELVLALDRSVVAAALADRDRLGGQLTATRGEFSGERLLKVRAVSDGDFFARLGLQEGDVLLAVNGAFVTVDHDHFLDAFAEGDVVRLLVMRRGRPHSWEYRVR